MVSAWTRNFGLSMSRSTCSRGSFISTGYESMKHNLEEEGSHRGQEYPLPPGGRRWFPRWWTWPPLKDQPEARSLSEQQAGRGTSSRFTSRFSPMPQPVRPALESKLGGWVFRKGEELHMLPLIRVPWPSGVARTMPKSTARSVSWFSPRLRDQPGGTVHVGVAARTEQAGRKDHDEAGDARHGHHLEDPTRRSGEGEVDMS